MNQALRPAIYVQEALARDPPGGIYLHTAIDAVSFDTADVHRVSFQLRYAIRALNS